MARPATASPDRILAAAAAEFAAHGYGGARVDRIARRARVNKAMLYYHFGSKRALYRALLRSTFALAADRLRSAAESADTAVAALDRATQVVAEFASERRHFPAIVLREIAEGGAHLDRETLEALSSVPRAFAGVLARGVREGVFQPTHPFAAYVTMMAPIVFFFASAAIRRELEASHLVGASLPPADFIAHAQHTMRQVLMPARSGGPPAQPERLS